MLPPSTQRARLVCIAQRGRRHDAPPRSRPTRRTVRAARGTLRSSRYYKGVRLSTHCMVSTSVRRRLAKSSLQLIAQPRSTQQARLRVPSAHVYADRNSTSCETRDCANGGNSTDQNMCGTTNACHPICGTFRVVFSCEEDARSNTR